MTRRPTATRGRKSAPGASKTRKGRALPPSAEVEKPRETPLPAANVAHCMDGRLRVKLPEKKGDDAFFASVAESMSACPGVEKIQANPVTGSILFVHSTTPRRIERFAIGKGLFCLAPWRTARKTLFGEVADVFQNWNRGLKQSTGGGLDIPSVIFLSLVLSGIYQVLRGNLVMPAWYTAFYYALGIFTRGYVETPDEGPNALESEEDSSEFPDDLGDNGDD